MSIDTVRISTKSNLPSTGWAEKETQMTDLDTGEVKRKFLTTGQSEDGKVIPRLTYYPDGPRLLAEVSLPKFRRGENFTLLSDDEIAGAVDDLIVWAEEKVTHNLPDKNEWRVSRMDSCYSWTVGDDMQAYIGVFSQLPVNGYMRKSYASDNNTAPGFTWQASTLRVNAYDKGLETLRPEAKGLLRLEVQALNSSACRTASRRRNLNQSAADLVKGGVGRREVSDWLKRIRMPGTVKTHAGLFHQLASEFGADDAAPRLWFIIGFREMGYGIKKTMPERTYQRRMAEATKRGWLATSPGRELSGLKVKI